jgi:hypothetical protein
MRRYSIVSGILLILSIIDFALAAPVLVQEKRQERVDVVHIPKDVIIALEKRWEEDLEKLGEEYLKTGGKPVEPSSSAPSGPDPGSTNVVQPPAPNPASSTANPEPLMDPSSCSSSISSRQGLWARGNCLRVSWSNILEALRDMDLHDDGLHGDGLHGDGLTEPLFSLGLGSSSGQEYKWVHAPQPNPSPNLNRIPNSRPSIDPSADPNFDWEYWMNAEHPPLGSASPEEFSQAHRYQVDPLNPPSTSGYAPSPPEPEHEVVTPSPLPSNLGSPKAEDEAVARPPSSPNPELPLDHQSLSADSQLVDLQAAIYAAKGKAKESRRISGTARDVGNAAQRELQPA